MSLKTFEEEDEDVWVVDGFQISDPRPPIRISVNKEGSPPSIDEIAKIEKITADIEPLILRAAELILDNYSYDHFKKLGIDESKLAEETPEAIAAAVTLIELSFFDVDGGGFEASFTAPWDPHHSFDVEHEESEPTCCAVNG